MNLSDNLKILRQKSGMSQRELAEKVGVSTSCVSKWESGHMLPQDEKLKAISSALGISKRELSPAKGPKSTPKAASPLEKDEKKLLSTFRGLDEFGKRAVLLVAVNEKRRVSEMRSKNAPKSKQKANESKPARLIPLYLTPAAAGYSAMIDDVEFTMIEADKSTPKGADFAVVIHGDSMLPYLKDGDRAYVKRAEEVSVGDVGLFSVNGAQYCKLYYKTGSGDIWLVSTNEALSSSNVLIKAGSSDTIHCFGKVLTSKKARIPDYFMKSLISKK